MQSEGLKGELCVFQEEMILCWLRIMNTSAENTKQRPKNDHREQFKADWPALNPNSASLSPQSWDAWIDHHLETTYSWAEWKLQNGGEKRDPLQTDVYFFLNVWPDFPSEALDSHDLLTIHGDSETRLLEKRFQFSLKCCTTAFEKLLELHWSQKAAWLLVLTGI